MLNNLIASVIKLPLYLIQLKFDMVI